METVQANPWQDLWRWLKANRLTAFALLTTGLALTLWVTSLSGAHTFTDTAGGTWHCTDAGTFQGWPVLTCEGQQVLSSDSNDGQVRGFRLDDGRVTFRVTRWGHTPDQGIALEVGGAG